MALRAWCRQTRKGRAARRPCTPVGLSELMVERGSVAVDGVSLTVPRTSRGRRRAGFDHRLSRRHTTLGALKAGDAVHVEADIIAKHGGASSLNRPHELCISRKAIEDIRDGKFVIVADDEDRENEGDLVCAAQLVTPEMVNFMIRRAGGLICVALTGERVDQLGLAPMSETNVDDYRRHTR